MMPGLPKSTDPYDARLKVVAEEIRAILRRHNMAGAVALSSDTHGEFVMHLPTWCGVTVEPRGLRIRLQRDDPAKANATVKMMVGLRDILTMYALAIGDAFDQVKQEVERTGGEISMDEAQITPDRDAE